MLKKIAFDRGKLATSPYSSRLPGYKAQKLPGEDGVNVAAVNAEFDAAGWKDTNGNGTRDKGGVELAFDVTTSTPGPTPITAASSSPTWPNSGSPSPLDRSPTTLSNRHSLTGL